jgi:hypothetical protein
VNAPPGRVPYSSAGIAKFCFDVARSDAFSAIGTASRVAQKGSLNLHTAAELAADLTEPVRTAESVAGALGGIRTDDLDAVAYDTLAIAKRHSIGLLNALRRAQGFAADIAMDASDTQLSRRDLRRNLDSARDHCANLIDDLAFFVRLVVQAEASNIWGEEAAKRPDRSKRVAPAAARVLTVTVWPLPAISRARYAAEFRTELWELAQSGASRRAQVAYATRQLRSAWRLRAALRTPARQRAGAL